MKPDISIFYFHNEKGAKQFNRYLNEKGILTIRLNDYCVELDDEDKTPEKITFAKMAFKFFNKIEL